jgi:hypothetical protein
MFDIVSCSFSSISFRTYIKVKEQFVERRDMNVNEHEKRLSNIKIVKKQLVVRKDIDLNEHETISNITLRHKLK